MGDLSLSALTEVIYRAKDSVAAEPFGFIPASSVNISDVPTSINGTVDSLVIPALTVNESETPSMTLPGGDNITVTKEQMTIGFNANVSIPVEGENWLKATNTVGGDAFLQGLFAQAIRGLRNKIETKAGGIIYKYGSRAVGTAGTTPFASNWNVLNSLRQILEDNGAPVDDGNLSCVVNTSAATNLRNLSALYKANESGTTDLLRKGTLLDLSGFMLKTSAGIASHTAGAGAGYDIVTAGEAIGQTTLSLEGGTVNTTGFKAGDIITLDTDTANSYVVQTGLTATSGDIVIGAPGLRVAGVNASELTIGGSYTANIGMHRSAVEIAMRPPALPPGGDAAVERMTIMDEQSGLVFTIARYVGFQKAVYYLSVNYGVKVWKPDYVAVLRG